MTQKMENYTLFDAEQGVYQDFFEFSETLSGAFPVKITKRRLSGGVSDGVDIIEIENGRLSLTILPTRGMGIHRGRCGDVELKWDSPVRGPVHPAFVPVCDPGGLGFLEGFDEWLVRCGLESNGAPEFDADGRLRYPLHGRIGNLPACHVSLSVNRETGEISLTGKVRESKLFFKNLELTSTLTTFAGSAEFTVRDTVTNHSAEPGEYELLYHINTGQPLASPGARVMIPFHRMAPRTPVVAVADLPTWNLLGPETPGSAEVVHFFEAAAGADGFCPTMLVSAAGNRGLGISFRPSELPYFSLWKSRLANADGYVCGMEPAVNFPSPRSFEKSQGRVVTLPPGGSRTHELRFSLLTDAEAVRKMEAEILAVPAEGKIEPAPVPEWSGS